MPAMLTTQLNEFANNGSIVPRCVIKLTDYLCNPLPGKKYAQNRPFSEKLQFLTFFPLLCPSLSGTNSKIIVIVDLEPVSGPLNGQLGAPIDIGNAVTQSAVTPQAAYAPPVPQAAVAFPPQQHVATAPVIDAATGQVLTPVKMLDRYLNRWTIRVRCSSKSPPKEYNGGSNGGGRLFSVTFLDETGEIRATMFNDAMDKFYPILNEGCMYVISNGKLKFANKKFTSVKHAYELTLNVDATVIPVDSIDTVPNVRFDFTPIDNIQECKKDDMIDVVGVVIATKAATTIATKKGDTARRNVTLADNSGRAIELTLWGDQSNSFDAVLEQYGAHPIIALKGVRVSDFGGRSLSAMTTTEFEVDPAIEDANAVRAWWPTVPDEGRHLPNLSGGGGSGGGGAGAASREKTLASIQLESMGTAQQDYLTVPNVWVTQFKRDGTLWYKACANPDCKGRKVFEESTGNFKCHTCGGVNNYRLRWVCNFTAFDHTGREYISGFGDAGVTLLGVEAENINQHIESGRTDLVNNVFEEHRFKSYSMRLGVKQEEYQGTMRNKVSVQSLTPIDFVADSERLLNRIAELQRQ